MKAGISLVVALGFVAVVSIAELKAQKTQATATDHTVWISEVLKEIELVKVGMTRNDLLKVFTTEGGLSTRRSRTYVYRKCPYIKVDVEFQPVQHVDDTLTQFPEDKIVRISKPYLQWSILD